MNDSISHPVPRTEEAISFLQMISQVQWDLAAIPPDGGGPEFKTFFPSERSAAAKWIDDRQGRSGLYYHINQLRSGVRDRKATKTDIALVRFLHADIDLADEETLSKIRDFAPKPTIIVFSGGGFHPLWKLREPSGEFDRVERINMGIASELGGDNCHNIDRLLRLPGTINVPNAKKRAAGRFPVLARVI